MADPPRFHLTYVGRGRHVLDVTELQAFAEWLTQEASRCAGIWKETGRDIWLGYQQGYLDAADAIAHALTAEARRQ